MSPEDDSFRARIPVKIERQHDTCTITLGMTECFDLYSSFVAAHVAGSGEQLAIQLRMLLLQGLQAATPVYAAPSQLSVE
jgi:hypothetical protein